MKQIREDQSVIDTQLFGGYESDSGFRTCSNSKVLSIFGILLADFRLKFQGLYTIVDMTLEILSRKAVQKSPKIDEP